MMADDEPIVVLDDDDDAPDGMDAPALHRPPAPAAPVAPPSHITSGLLDRLVELAFAVCHHATLHAALRTLVASTAEAAERFAHEYGCGYLPPEFQEHLTDDERRSLSGLRLGGCVILPARDAQGALVDLAALHQSGMGAFQHTLFEQPRGLIYPRSGLNGPSVIACDALPHLGRLFQDGHRALLLRGPADAQANGPQLRALGVTQILLFSNRHSEAIEAGLHAAGIEVVHASRKGVPAQTHALRQVLAVAQETAARPRVVPLSSASTPAERPTGDLLTGLMARSTTALASCKPARQYLHRLGLADEAIWQRFRLGAAVAGLDGGLTETDWEALARLRLVHRKRGSLLLSSETEGAINLPTCDPREPDRVLGVVRIYPIQNKDSFLTPPVGLACATDLDTHRRVVLVDAPILGLRLAQLGIADVAIAQDPEVLVPLRSWLAGKTIVLAGQRHDRLRAMHAALGGVGTAASTAILLSNLSRSPRASLELLGLDPELLREEQDRTQLTPMLLREIHAFSRARIAAGEGAEVLREVQADCADLIAAYGIGYFPERAQATLSTIAKKALQGRRIDRGLVLPAYDAQGAIVDLAIVRPTRVGSSIQSLATTPSGLLAPALLHATDRLIITDSFTWLARLFQAGHRHVLLVRHVEEVARAAERLAQAGVRAVELRLTRREMEGVVPALRQAGIQVELRRGRVAIGEEVPPVVPTVSLAPAPASVAPHTLPVDEIHAPAEPSVPVAAPSPATLVPPPLATLTIPDDSIPDADRMHVVEEDAAGQVLILGVGPHRYAIELRDDGDFRRKVTLRAHGQAVADRFDLTVPAQCLRFAQNAGRRTSIPSAQIVAHLSAALDLLRRRASTGNPAPISPRTGEQQEAQALLGDPALLQRIVADIDAMGWIGEPRTQALLYLAALSRLLPRPLWCLYRGPTGAAPWHALGLIASLTPPEDLLVAHRVTNALLTPQDDRSLRHRLLLVDQAETMRPEAAIALRVLHERGGIGWATVGEASGQRGEARGPVAVLAATAGDIDHRCRGCFLPLGVDERPEATAAILAAQRRRQASAGGSAAAATIMARHHALQRLLERRPVVIPWAEDVVFPTGSVRDRADQERFFTLIRASALLHQFQRERQEGAIVADTRDFDIAVRLSEGLLGQGGEGLSPQARQLLAAITGASLTTSTMADLGALLPDWTRWALRAALQDLLEFGYLTCPASRRGQVRSFTLAVDGMGHAPRIALRSNADHRRVGELADLGGEAPPTPSAIEGVG